LFFDIDSSHNIFVLGLRWSRKHFSEDVQPAVASDEPDQVIAAFLRFVQGMLRGIAFTQEDQLYLLVG